MILWFAFISAAFGFVAVNGDYVEIFRDDFNGVNLNTTLWTATDQASEVNEELQYYLPFNVFLRDGKLVLRTERRHYLGRLYTSGRVDTKGKFEFAYGEMEWSVKLPGGQGLWPALWAVYYDCPAAVPCTTWPPEIDVMEFRGDIPNRVSHALHYGLFPSNEFLTKETYSTGLDFTQTFHTFKTRWEPGRLVWYVDGREAYRIEDSIVPSERMHLIMNLAIGGNYANFIVPNEYTRFPAEMLIDYVVVRQFIS